MHRRALRPLVVVAFALAMPGTAGAKGIASLQVCGASGCQEVGGAALGDVQRTGPLDGHPTAAAARSAPAPHYWVRLSMHHEGEGWTSWFVPGRGLWRGQDEKGHAMWLEMSERAAAAMRRAVRDVEPFPTPRLTSVRVGSRRVSDPEAYRFVYTAGTELVGCPVARDWVPVVLRADRSSPWTGTNTMVRFSPSRGELERDGLRFELPASLAERIASDGGLASGGGGEGAGRDVPWLPLGLVAGASLLVIGLWRRNSAAGSGVVRAWWAGHAPRRS